MYLNIPIAGTCVDISSWGRNTNFTLGHGDEKERYIPEAIDVFARRVKISIRDVSIYTVQYVTQCYSFYRTMSQSYCS